MEVKIESSWKEVLSGEFEKDYFINLRELYREAIAKSLVLPLPKHIFNAFNLVGFYAVRVVILGQDPYHGVFNHNIYGEIPQAHGLSFSVQDGVPPPPSLKNIFKELNRDLGCKIPQSGDLSPWCKEGVLLLNALLSVEYKKPLSHKDFGWEIFTDKVISELSSRREKLVFMLWGNYARSKKKLIDSSKHFILEAPHPSPLARGFVGCGHFSKCNEILRLNGLEPINWSL